MSVDPPGTPPAMRHARDWVVAGVASLAGAYYVGGGVMFFNFRSRSAGFLGTFIFGGGIGYGGQLGGTVPVNTRGISYSPIRSDRIWKARDLDGAVGHGTLGNPTA